MKILLINTVCGAGSTGRICANLAETFESDGHEVKIAYGRYVKGTAAVTPAMRVRIGNDTDVRFHGILTRLTDDHAFGSTKATTKFLNWVEEYKPDIVHLHNLHGYYINVDYLFNYLKVNKIPVVWTFHDCWPMTGHCTHFYASGCEKWKTGCNSCPQKERYPRSNFLDHSAINYERKKLIFGSLEKMIIVTPSKWLKKIVEQSFLQKYEIQVINNGIDTAVFKPTDSELREKYKLNNSKVVLGVANGWGANKGLEYLERMSNDLPEGWKLVVIGLLDEQLKRIPKGMIGLKIINNAEELAAWYSLADVFVNPTLEDTYPTTNLEAQACGTPVVTFASDGAPETVIPGKGFIVRRLDYELLLNKTIEAAKLKNTIGQMHVKDKIQFGKEYEELYKRLLMS